MYVNIDRIHTHACTKENADTQATLGNLACMKKTKTKNDHNQTYLYTYIHIKLCQNIQINTHAHD